MVLVQFSYVDCYHKYKYTWSQIKNVNYMLQNQKQQLSTEHLRNITAHQVTSIDVDCATTDYET